MGKNRWGSVVLTLAAALIAVEAHGQTSAAPGRMIISGSGSFSQTHDNTSNTSTTTLSLQPSVLYFFWPRLAAGGSVQGSLTSTSGSRSSSWGVGPSARFFLTDLNGEWLPFVAGTVTPGHGHAHIDAPVPGTSDQSSLVWDGSLGMTRMLAPQVGVTGEAYYSHTRTTSESGPVSSTRTSRAIGLRFGVTAFLK